MKRLVFKDLSVTVTPKEGSEIEAEIICPAEIFAVYKSQAIKELGHDLSIPGFRKGHIPEKILVQNIGEDRILSEMADAVIQDAYIAIIAEKKLDPIGTPSVTITKIAPGNEFSFRIKVAVMPEVKLSDYKAAAKKAFTHEKGPDEVSEEEINNALTELRKRYAQMKHKKTEVKDEDIPTLDDAFAKELGGFENLDGLRTHIKGEIAAEKKSRARDKARMQVLEDIIKDMTVDLPRVLIEGELDRMLGEFEHTLSRTGATLDNYLEQTKTTREKLRSSWEKDAEKRVKGQLVLTEIARIEKIAPPEELVEREVKTMSEHYKNADPIRLRGYVEMLMGNDAVFSFLESQAPQEKA